MVKYFLPAITVLIIIQTLFLIDDIFFSKKKSIHSYKIKMNNDSFMSDNEIQKREKKKNELNFSEIFKNADLNNGKKISKKCSGRHDFSKNQVIKIGPPLWSIVDKKIASASSFQYSEPLKNFTGIWNIKTLNYFLEDPQNFIVGTKMLFKGLKKSEDRADLIFYLEYLK